jgi:hypothetical protein
VLDAGEAKGSSSEPPPLPHTHTHTSYSTLHTDAAARIRTSVIRGPSGSAVMSAALTQQVRAVLGAAVEAEGSSSEDTSDEAFERLHAPLLEDERLRLNGGGGQGG